MYGASLCLSIIGIGYDTRSFGGGEAFYGIVSRYHCCFSVDGELGGQGGEARSGQYAGELHSA